MRYATAEERARASRESFPAPVAAPEPEPGVPPVTPRRPLADHAGQTADHIAPDFVPMGLLASFQLDLGQPVPLTAGYVHFIRFVSGEGTFSILNERWPLDKTHWAGRTIRATIDLAAQQLKVYHQPVKYQKCQMITQFDYPLEEELQPLASTYHRPRAVLWPEKH